MHIAAKALNAQAAGAVGVLLFNQGDTAARLDAILATLAPSSALIPVFFASYSVGSSLALSPGSVLRMRVTEADLAVPEPTAVGLLALGLVGSFFARARRRV
jgi:hypothetical protein